jgi:hypothetical protein
MKTQLAFIILLLLLSKGSCAAQWALLEITGIGRDGVLAWTNRVCAPEALYEVQRASSPVGPWTRVALVTNASSFTVTNPSVGAAFYQVVWSGGAPLVMDYAFDEGFGFTSVTGRLSLTLYDDAVTGMGTWTFQRTPWAVSMRHPVGTSTRMGGGYSHGDVGGGADGWDVFAAFYLRGTDEESGTVVLQGTLYRGEVGGRCVFTRMTGTVYEYIYHDTWEPIGTFTATRVPQIS